MLRTFDCFPFFNENDILAIRFEELYPVVDRFVIVQSEVTFRGNSKPDYFNYKRHAKYMDKVELVTIPDRYAGSNAKGVAWMREKHQRNSLTLGIKDVQPDDIVLLSDADEIPRRRVVEGLKKTHLLDEKPITIELDVFCYALNVLTEQVHTVKMFKWSNFKKDMESMRKAKAFSGYVVNYGGWEFSSLGTADDLLYKLKNFSHSEFDTPDLTIDALRQRMLNLTDIVGREGIQHRKVSVNDRWPEAVKNNPEAWEDFIW